MQKPYHQHLRRLLLLAAPLAVMAPAAVAHATDFYVDASASPGGDGTLASPFRLISDAHAAVETGDDVTIHVAGGTYDDNVGDGADEYHTFTRYTFLGGYAPGFGSRDPAVNETVVRASDTSEPVFDFDNAESVTIDGFTITNGRSGVVIAGWASGRTAIVRSCRIVHNGHFTGNHEDSSLVNGAGVRLSGRDVLLSDSVIEENDAGKYGGGAYIGDSEESGAYAIVERNVIRNNEAHTLSAHGGGIWLSMSGVVRGNLIEGNAIDVPSGGGAGGGLIVIGTWAVAHVERNIVRDNHARSGGGGIFVDDEGTATIVNNIVTHNTAGATGAGVDVDGLEVQPSYATLANNTIAFNGTGDGRAGEGLFVRGGSQVTSTNDLFWQNGGDDLRVLSDGAHLSIDHGSFVTSAQQGVAQGAGNVSIDPMFSGPDDLTLSASSPAIDAGTTHSGASTDFRCIPRPQGAGPDLGAFEQTAGAVAPASDCQLPIGAVPPGGGEGGGNGGSGGSGTDGGGAQTGGSSDADGSLDGGSSPDGGGAAGSSATDTGAGGGAGEGGDDGCSAARGPNGKGAWLLLGAALALASARRRCRGRC